MNSEDSKKQKRHKRKQNEDDQAKGNQTSQPGNEISASSTQEPENYMNYQKYFKNVELNEKNIPKFKQYFEKIDLAVQLKNDNNAKQLLEIFEALNKKHAALEIENYQYSGKSTSLQAEHASLKDRHTEINKKVNDKDKLCKMIIDKAKTINDEKNELLQNEGLKRNALVEDTQNYVKELQEKHEQELPEKQILIEENQRLRKEIQECAENTLKMKDQLEAKLKDNELEALHFEDKSQNGLQQRMEILTSDAQKNILENSELKAQVLTYEKKNEELQKIVDLFNIEYEKLKNEIATKKSDSAALAEENAVIRKRVKNTKITKEVFEPLIMEYEKIKKQLAAMNSLNKTLTEQYEKLYKEKYPPPVEQSHEEIPQKNDNGDNIAQIDQSQGAEQSNELPSEQQVTITSSPPEFVEIVQSQTQAYDVETELCRAIFTYGQPDSDVNEVNKQK